MILRRVIEHVKEQNWTAVGLDFVIVVLGVFIGIQVANWNAQNADRRVAEKYLADIAEDVRADIVELSFTRDAALDRVGAADYVLRQTGADNLSPDYSITRSADTNAAIGLTSIDIPDQKAPAPEKRNQLWSLITGVYAYDTTRSAYDALIGSGKIDLIGDPEIMRALREYYYLVNGLSQTQSRTIVPGRQMAIQAGIEHGMSPDGRIAEAALIAAIEQDASLAAVIAATREYAALHILLCDSLDQKAKELLQLLAERKE
ncbi:MAG: hypothetical protein R3C58_00140 [Parvularculaceae bacterium]